MITFSLCKAKGRLDKIVRTPFFSKEAKHSSKYGEALFIRTYYSLDRFNLNVDSREKSTTKSNKRQRTHVPRNKFRTIAVSWCGRNPRACYTRRELSDIFAAFGPIKNVRFLSPRFVEIEFVWLGSACLAVRAPKVQLPGKVILHRQWADTSMHRQLWCKKDSRPK